MLQVVTRAIDGSVGGGLPTAGAALLVGVGTGVQVHLDPVPRGVRDNPHRVPVQGGVHLGHHHLDLVLREVEPGVGNGYCFS